MVFLFSLIGSALSAISAGAAATAAAATTTVGIGGLLGGAGAATALGIAAKSATRAAIRKATMEAALRAAGCVVAGGICKECGESLVKNVFCDPVKPRRGSVLKVDLACGSVVHTGVYLGNDRIAEVTDLDGDAVVREVSPSEFLNGDGLVRTGTYIYVAAAKEKGKYRALASESIARRAERSLGHRGKYNLAFNNCHMFTRYCITGEEQNLPTWSINRVASAIRDKFGVGHVSWRSTGDFA